MAITRNGTPTGRVDAVDRDAALLHHLEQRGLGLGARAVDLVGEHDVGEDRAGVELERALLLVVHRDAGDVAGEQVGGELDARVRALARSAPMARASDVLPVPGTSSSSTWPSLSIAVQHELDDVTLAEHGALDVVGELRERLGEPVACSWVMVIVPLPVSVGWVRGAGRLPGVHVPLKTAVAALQVPPSKVPGADQSTVTRRYFRGHRPPSGTVPSGVMPARRRWSSRYRACEVSNETTDAPTVESPRHAQCLAAIA